MEADGTVRRKRASFSSDFAGGCMAGTEMGLRDERMGTREHESMHQASFSVNTAGRRRSNSIDCPMANSSVPLLPPPPPPQQQQQQQQQPQHRQRQRRHSCSPTTVTLSPILEGPASMSTSPQSTGSAVAAVLETQGRAIAHGS